MSENVLKCFGTPARSDKTAILYSLMHIHYAALYSRQRQEKAHRGVMYCSVLYCTYYTMSLTQLSHFCAVDIA